MTHTPTPWQISDTRTVDDTPMIVGGEGFEFGLIADVTEDFDAAFIVKAVNSHEALMSLLETAGDLLRDSRSNHIAGSGPDEAWDKTRESLLKDIDAIFSHASKDATE